MRTITIRCDGGCGRVLPPHEVAGEIRVSGNVNGLHRAHTLEFCRECFASSALRPLAAAFMPVRAMLSRPTSEVTQ